MKFFKNTFINFIDSFFSLIVTLLITKLFINHLGIELYGFFIFLTLLSTYGVLSLFDFGMIGTIISFSSRYRSKNNFTKINKLWTFCNYFYFLISCIAILLIYIFFSFNFFGFSDSILKFYDHTILFPTLLLTFFTFIGYLYLSFLKSFESFFEIQIINIIFNFFKLLIVFISILFSFDMFFIISFIALFKFIQTFLYFYILKAHFHLKFYFIKLRFKEIKIWTSYSSILFLSSLVGFCFNIFDKVIIAAKLGLANIGLYDAASKPKDGLKSVLGVLYSAIDPLTVKVFHLKGKSNVSQLFFDVSFFIIIIFIPFFIFIISNMDMLINIWLGDNVNNIEIINYAIILSITLLINLHSSVANTMLVALREAKSLLPFQIISAIIVIFVTILFIDKLGIYACIIALICGNLFSSFFTLLKLKLFLNISSNVLFYKLISFLLFLIITFCFTFLLKSIVPVTFFKSDILYLFLQFAILFVIVLAIFNIQIKKTYENFKRYYEK